MGLQVTISPHGIPFLERSDEETAPVLNEAAAGRLDKAFAGGAASALLHLGTAELQTALPGDLSFLRDFARDYLTRFCHTPGVETGGGPMEAPPREELSFRVLGAPPMRGLEYLNADVLLSWWGELDALVRSEIAAHPGGPGAWLKEKNPLWHLVGRVTFHLAENKRDPENPFAFMATYSSRLSAQGKVQHLPLGRALQEYAGAKNKPALLSLLMPINKSAEHSDLAKELVEGGDVFQPVAWTPAEAYRFLRDIPVFEASGVIVRVPDWWKAKRPPRPQVSVSVGARRSKLDIDAMLDFSVRMTLEGENLTEAEIRELLASNGGLVSLKGKWVEVDKEKLAQAMEHWKEVEKQAGDGISFLQGMRLLSGVPLEGDAAVQAAIETRDWTGIEPGEWLGETLEKLRSAEAAQPPKELRAELRPYQGVGVHWMRFLVKLGLGACLADDMGLGKTIQVLTLLLHMRQDRAAEALPSLLIVPATLIGNWKSEIARFAPSLSVVIGHPSEMDVDDAPDFSGVDLVITSYAMASRLDWVCGGSWNLVILDEAQAIKNAGTRQSRTVKSLKSTARIVLTGTPVENRLSDLWSLFDFINPGLLGSAKAFGKLVKSMAPPEGAGYAPLRKLVQPYILRRMKTDKSIIADLPDKTEVNAFCGLSREQAALYEQSVSELAGKIRETEGIARRGLVLAFLMRFKQICNHPSQWLGDSDFDAQRSGKFARLKEICEELAERQEKVLVFTQFREMTEPLAEYLRTVFGRPGLVLHGGTAVGRRKNLVDDFQRDGGPPFFVLSIKAGGTGLNLTAAAHVIHFDRWWNPAVENQATDRAFRIGQKRNVMVHKFVCRGTVEEKIDALIAEKTGLSRELLGGGNVETKLTELSDKDLLRLVSLDIRHAVDV